jgi:hypothetical protein
MAWLFIGPRGVAPPLEYAEEHLARHGVEGRHHAGSGGSGGQLLSP